MKQKNTKIDISKLDEQIRLRIEYKSKGYLTWGELAEEFGISRQYLHTLINREVCKMNLIHDHLGSYSEKPLITGSDVINK